MNCMTLGDFEQLEWHQFEVRKLKAYEALEKAKENLDEWEKQWGLNGILEKDLREKQQSRREALKINCSKEAIITIRKNGTQL